MAAAAAAAQGVYAGPSSACACASAFMLSPHVRGRAPAASGCASASTLKREGGGAASAARGLLPAQRPWSKPSMRAARTESAGRVCTT